jgi:glycosyltransferase involved in cell wall biosynthesis
VSRLHIVGATQLDDVDRAAMQAFAREYGEAPLSPVTVVIAAYNEADNIGPVLDQIPRTVCGLPVSVLVVDDGSKDGTADVARRHGVFVCAPATNRGQGAALRLGYHLAGTHGAALIATTDGDGQYDASELELIIGPIVQGRADFVTGSRRLGLYTTDDVVRHAGVHIFASLMSVLARRRVTDTSNGFRAFRADIVDHLILEQPQYQATELLLGVIYRGFHVLEIGTSMHQRTSGQSKKGPNLVYGYRFGRVIMRTWLRELRRNRQEHRTMRTAAPALAPLPVMPQSDGVVAGDDIRDAG